MTDERDFDRISQAWLDLMPSEVPDRTVAAVLQAVATTPQVRRPLRRLLERNTNMNRILAIAALAAAAIIAVGGGLWLSRPDRANIGPPAASPSDPAPSPSLSAPIPQQLMHSWLGEVVDAPGLPSGRDRAILRIDATTIEMAASPSALLSSDITSVDSGALRLVSRETSSGCTAGDVGLYVWSVSPKGSILDLGAPSDECQSRRAAFNNALWERSACRNAENLCLGDLEAGTYKSQYIGPRLDEGEAWTANFGALSYTVPDGWSNSYDYPDSYVLMRSNDYASVSDARDATKDLIEVMTRPAAALQDATCNPAVKPGVGRSVDELIEHVTQHPDLKAGKPQPITIDGHAGKYVDVQIAPSADRPCPDLDGNLVFLFTESGPDVTNSGIEQYGLWKTTKARVVLLDLGDGDVVLISIHAFTPASFETLLPEAMPIVTSMRFE